MASFPTSAKAFASRSAGQTIGSQHVNDLQDEVNAIEDGYLNATARLNSSGSTVTSLSVTGGSTLTTLSLTGGSTFTLRPVVPPPDAALVYLQSTGAVASSALSTLSFLSEAFLTNSSMHSTTTNPDRLTPQSTGIYQLAAQIQVGVPSAASQLFVEILDSSGTVITAQDSTPGTAVGGPGAKINCVGFKRFDLTGGYAVCRFVNNAGGSTHSLSSGVIASWFSVVKL